MMCLAVYTVDIAVKEEALCPLNPFCVENLV